MSNQNAISAIQAGMMNYIGAAMDALPDGGILKNRAIVAMLMDAIISVSKPDGKECNLGILEPAIRGIINIFRQRQSILAAKQDKETILFYEAIISDLEEVIDSTRLNEKGESS